MAKKLPITKKAITSLEDKINALNKEVENLKIEKV